MICDSVDAAQKTQPVDAAQTSKIGDLLDQVKALAAKQWSAAPLTAAQAPVAH